MNAGILNAPTASSAEALALLAEVSKKFEKAYREVIEACTRGLPLTICTIYNGSFPDTRYQELISTALTIFNDVILRVGIDRHLSVIDLRFVCSKAEDFANPLEPSSIGGAKIARLIFEVVSISSRDDISARIFTL
jgi:hypothetical protein